MVRLPPVVAKRTMRSPVVVRITQNGNMDPNALVMARIACLMRVIRMRSRRWHSECPM